MNAPSVSVIVTCYNVGRFLHEAVDSVLTQTFQDFEIIVVDDGSTDADTVALLRGLEGPRTRVVHMENRGLPGARNEGFRHASGRLLCALDADDRLERTWLAKGVAFLDACPEITFVSHWLRTFGDESADWMPERCDLETLLTANTVNGAALVRREAMAAVGGYDEEMVHGCEDWDLWLTMVERGFRGAIIPEVLFFYRRRADSMSRMMSVGDRPQALYETLMRKHEASYRHNISTLVAAREREVASARQEVQRLAVEHAGSLMPSLSYSRRRLVALRDKAERVSRDIEGAPEVSSLREALQTERTRVEAERARVAALETEARRLHGEIVDLRNSLTWRLTQPIRAVVDWFWRPGRT